MTTSNFYCNFGAGWSGFERASFRGALPCFRVLGSDACVRILVPGWYLREISTLYGVYQIGEV